jgi:hypothetical protein
VGLSVPSAIRRRINFKGISIMNTIASNESDSPAHSHAFSRALSLQDLQHKAPAIFAETASTSTKPTYRFISKCG